MADQTQTPKRSREEETAYLEGDYEDPKRPKTYNNILSFLENDEDELHHQDLSDIFTTLQQELSCDSSSANMYGGPLPFAASSEADQLDQHGAAASDCSPTCSKDGEEKEENDERVRVMRHLLEASDDELGLPNSLGSTGGDGDEINGGDLPFPLSDGLWEFEDEAANYYAMLQAELFI